MRSTWTLAFFVSSLGLLAGAQPASAQPASAQLLGTFQWQLQPYCNVVTVNVTGQSAMFTPDAGIGGPVRPVPVNGIAPGSMPSRRSRSGLTGSRSSAIGTRQLSPRA